MKGPSPKPKVVATYDDSDVDLNEFVDQVFSMSGAFAKHFPGYQTREGQVEFAHAVTDAIQDKVVVLAEAGTGTGKSFGALVPAIMSNVHHGSKVVYVTANINLQEQIVRKDLPTLVKILGEDFTFALAKGFSNYLCVAKLDDSDAQRMTGKLNLPIFNDLKAFETIREWRATTTTGDFSDLPFEPSGYIKSLVSVASDECYGKKCSHFFSGCFPRKARKAFNDADVIVTNYHLYFLDLNLQRMGQRILPEHHIVIFDEFHEAAEIARTFLGERLSFGSVKTAVDALAASGPRADRLKLPRNLDPELRGETEAEARRFFKELYDLSKNPNKYRARLTRKGQIDGQRLEQLLGRAAKKYTDKASEEGVEPEAREWLRNRSVLCTKQAYVIQTSREFEMDDLIFYIDVEESRKPGGDPKVALCREPLMPADILRENLFEKNAEPRSIVCCSATLTTSSRSNPFGYIAKQTGVTKFDECVAESPFDYSRCCFVVPKGLPNPDEDEFPGAVCQVLSKLLNITGGRTLGLFTSNRVMNEASRFLKAQKFPFNILTQGDIPRAQLVKRFKEDHTSVLLGTKSFWTGVDVPGDSLTCVFMDKIPFDEFNDPVLDAIKERDENWFKSYYVPKAVIAFKQGFGRLIRSVEDRGAVVCCDKRIVSKGYGALFRRAVPESVRFSDKLETVAEFTKVV